jgi:arylsulfatase A-like enzyme
MRTIFVLFDSLVRTALGCYGGTSIPTPNFDRFAAKAVTFDTHYTGSLPCMPARREMHTGRMNFLHRSWGPLEPFDDSFSEILQAQGIYTHLVSDHYHYWEDGGSSYHNRYSTWEFIRGQEWDKWKAMVEPPLDRFKRDYHPLQFSQTRADGRLQHLVNRESMTHEDAFCTPRTFAAGFEFLDANRDADNWLLHLEMFDPHEPFHAPERFRAMFPSGYQGPVLDWPRYARVQESPDEIRELRSNYAALVAMCDEYFGRLLDYMDTHDMWGNTAVILTTDHGLLLAEHDWWVKNRMPFYEEISHIPLLVYHPAHADQGGARRQALTQTIDLMPTVLSWYGIDVPPQVEGHDLTPLLQTEKKLRDVALFGMFGAATNVTDGRYVYFFYPQDMAAQELYEYTLMPMHQKTLFTRDELREATLVSDMAYTGGVPVLKIPARRNNANQPCGHTGQGVYEDTRTVLYDLQVDPGQNTPIEAPDVVARLIQHMIEVMVRNEAPPEAFLRLGIAANGLFKPPKDPAPAGRGTESL